MLNEVQNKWQLFMTDNAFSPTQQQKNTKNNAYQTQNSNLGPLAPQTDALRLAIGTTERIDCSQYIILYYITVSHHNVLNHKQT